MFLVFELEMKSSFFILRAFFYNIQDISQKLQRKLTTPAQIVQIVKITWIIKDNKNKTTKARIDKQMFEIYIQRKNKQPRVYFLRQLTLYFIAAFPLFSKCIKLLIPQSKQLNSMSQPSQNPKNSPRVSSNSYKIASIRGKLAHSPQLVQQFDSIISTYNTCIQSNTKTISSLQSSIKSILPTLKQALTNPSLWLSSEEAVRSKQKQCAILLQTKMYQFNDVYHSIAANSLLIEMLTLIKNNSNAEIDLKGLTIPNSKRELLAFYKEITHYYLWKQDSKHKGRNSRNAKEILKTNPEIACYERVKCELQEMAKNDELLVKISNKFVEIQQKLLGFTLEEKKINHVEEIEGKLQKILTYVQQSFSNDQNRKITPKNVKQHSNIISILTHLSTFNVGLLQQFIDKQADPQIKSMCTKLHQHIIKNNKQVQIVYDFLIEGTSDKISHLFPRSVKQLPLERKLTQCERLIKQLRHNPKIYYQVQDTPISKQYQQLDTIFLEEKLKDNKLQFDQQLLLAQESIYTLQIENKQLHRQKQQLKIQGHALQQKMDILKRQKCELYAKIDMIQLKCKESDMKNDRLVGELQQIRANQRHISSQLLGKEDQIIGITQNIINLTNQLNQITNQKEDIINHFNQKSIKCHIQLKVIDLIILPTVQAKSMEDVINFIQDVPPNVNSSPPCTPPQNKRDKFLIKHSRSLSNVDFLSQLMPQTIEKQFQNDNLSVTIDSEQLKKGLQIRERTIKKYQIYMEKQRKQAKKLRSEILELQSKIRSLQLGQIQMKQIIQNKQAQKYLRIEEEEQGQGYSSLIHIEDFTEKTEEIKSIEKITEKEVELKVKEEQLNFKIQEIIKHVLKLNTLKMSSPSSQNENDYIAQELIPQQINPQSKNTQESQQ